MRTTLQCGRKGSATHNEHRHIDAGDRDVVVRDFTGARTGTPLRDAELAYYEKTFADSIKATNEKYRAQGHPEKCRSIEQHYTGKRGCPEEAILQVGDRFYSVSREVFLACIQEFFRRINKWNREHGFPFKTLNTSIHFDEATPHLHWRRVWQYEENGVMKVGQSKALERAGIELPDPTKPENRYNNRKMVFDQMVRNVWQQVCKDHGLQIETKPIETEDRRQRHKPTKQYIDDKIRAELPQLQEQKADLEAEKATLEAQVRSSRAAATVAKAEEQEAKEAAEAAKKELHAIEKARDALVARDKAAQRAARQLAQEWGVTGKDYNPDR